MRVQSYYGAAVLLSSGLGSPRRGEAGAEASG